MILDVDAPEPPFYPMTQYELNLENIIWRATGNFGAGEEDSALDRSRLLALSNTITVGGVGMHLEAWEVHVNERGEQEVVHPDLRDDFDGVFSAFNPDSPFLTVEIEGREYVILMFPHGD